MVLKNRYVPYVIDVKPQSNRIKIELKGHPKITGIKMFDLDGKEIISQKTYPVSKASLELGPKSSVASGKYIVNVITDKGSIPYRVMVKR